MEVLDKFAHMDFQWCSDIPGGHGDPVELVRGLENSRPDFWATLAMHVLHAWPG